MNDPTHGRIDRDIQQAVDEMQPTSLGQRVAIENTLQSRRQAGWWCTRCHTHGHRYNMCPERDEDRVRVYVEPRDMWIGYYRGDTHNYVCFIPCIVIRWRRR